MHMMVFFLFPVVIGVLFFVELDCFYKKIPHMFKCSLKMPNYEQRAHLCFFNIG